MKSLLRRFASPSRHARPSLIAPSTLDDFFSQGLKLFFFNLISIAIFFIVTDEIAVDLRHHHIMQDPLSSLVQHSTISSRKDSNAFFLNLISIAIFFIVTDEIAPSLDLRHHHIMQDPLCVSIARSTLDDFFSQGLKRFFLISIATRRNR